MAWPPASLPRFSRVERRPARRDSFRVRTEPEKGAGAVLRDREGRADGLESLWGSA